MSHDERSGYLRTKPIRPKKIVSGIPAVELIEETFLAYNAGPPP